MIVVKVGGSLFDHPALGPALRAYVESLAPAEVLLVPGGGPVADAVRQLDRVHGLGEEAAHWVALRTLSVTAEFLERIARPPPAALPASSRPNPPTPLPEGRGEPTRESSSASPNITGLLSSCFLPSREGLGVGFSSVLDCFTFALEDEARPGALPHAWSVTTDSLAARAAIAFRAERLVLLKSIDIPPDTPWETAAANGWVDAHFPRIAPMLPCPIEVLNFRQVLRVHA